MCGYCLSSFGEGIDLLGKKEIVKDNEKMITAETEREAKGTGWGGVCVKKVAKESKIKKRKENKVT